MPLLPTGRGFYIWRVSRCEGGHIPEIINRALRCNVSWLCIKCGDQGRPWQQFSPALVEVCHRAGIRIYGWSYDVPNRIEAQAEVVRQIRDMGADGYLIDAEAEWDRDPHADEHARQYMDLLRPLSSDSFLLLDAPWDVIAYHRSFPFTAFATGLSARCPQNYHIAHGMSAHRSWARFVANWSKYHAQHPAQKLPLIPSLSTWQGATVEDVISLERAARSTGCPGVLHWVWDSCPAEIWASFATGKIPAWRS